MKISVIISTYNKPQWLQKVIWGYATQSFTDFELVVADDGSTRETALLIKRLRQETGLDIKHVWHRDLGYRKCMIQNRAIVAATGDYLVFTDGDCIPREDFLAEHRRLAAPNMILSGGYVRLPAGISQEIQVADITSRRVMDPRWLWRRGLRSPRDVWKSLWGKWTATLLDHLTTTRATLNGCNASMAREAVVGVNGFDERMQYGALDRELGERLQNSGLKYKQVRHRAICLHLWHERPYMTAEGWQRNAEIRRTTRQSGSVWTSYGIQQSPSQQDALRSA